MHSTLPTEQQWERASRGRKPMTHTFFSCGDDEQQLDEFAWFNQTWSKGPHPVLDTENQKLCNDLGLYHMHGNVLEWTSSWYAVQASNAERIESPRYRSVLRVLRGGAFDRRAAACRSSSRERYSPQTEGRVSGFRVSRV